MSISVANQVTPSEAAKAGTVLPLEFSTDEGQLKILGFWLFLVSDVLLFSGLFATYAVIYTHHANGPTAAQLFGGDLAGFLTETFLLLTSSFTCSLAIGAMRRGAVGNLTFWTIVTMLLGLAFVGLEIAEFHAFVLEGATLQTSAFLSGFYTLVGTHGAHVTLGLIWMGLVLGQLRKRGITDVTARKLFNVSLYWHFLDVVWVFIFTVVYLTGVM